MWRRFGNDGHHRKHDLYRSCFCYPCSGDCLPVSYYYCLSSFLTVASRVLKQRLPSVFPSRKRYSRWVLWLVVSFCQQDFYCVLTLILIRGPAAFFHLHLLLLLSSFLSYASRAWNHGLNITWSFLTAANLLCLPSGKLMADWQAQVRASIDTGALEAYFASSMSLRRKSVHRFWFLF